MKREVLYLIFNCLLILCLLAVSCRNTAIQEPNEEAVTEEATPAQKPADEAAIEKEEESTRQARSHLDQDREVRQRDRPTGGEAMRGPG